MTDPDTETALCSVCHVPVEAPKVVTLSPFVHYHPAALCKDCLLKAQIEAFERGKLKDRPYKLPYWRPSR